MKEQVIHGVVSEIGRRLLRAAESHVPTVAVQTVGEWYGWAKRAEPYRELIGVAPEPDGAEAAPGDSEAARRLLFSILDEPPENPDEPLGGELRLPALDCLNR